MLFVIGRQHRLIRRRDGPARPWVEPDKFIGLLDARSASVGCCSRCSPAVVCGSARRSRFAGNMPELGTGTMHVVDAKTAKGVREVHLTAALREELTLWRTRSQHLEPSDSLSTRQPAGSTTRRTSGVTCSFRRSPRRT